MILPLEQQVCSLESAKRLKELGFSQESLFYWFPFSKGIHEWQIVKLEQENVKGWKHFRKNNKDFYFYSAYTTAELGELLPATIDNKYGDCTRWFNSRITSKACVWYENNRAEERLEFCEDTEAEARALMLIYLAENNLCHKK